MLHIRITPLLLLLLIGLSMQSCGLVTVLYGIKQPKELSNSEMLMWANKYKIPAEDCYVLDTVYISNLNLRKSTNNSSEINNYLQPLQVFYYDKSWRLISHHANCDAGGFPNLKWNRNGAFDVFPPLKIRATDTILNLQKHYSTLNRISEKQSGVLDPAEYTIVIHWNRFMGRQSRRLIKLVQKNTALITSGKTKIIYVNNDNVLAGSR